MEKLNIAELLKDCPSGMELNCTMYEDVRFLDIVIKRNSYLIRITTPCGIKYLDKYGCYTTSNKAKCVIFPKGKTTWNGFKRPFKDGDIVRYLDSIAIFKEWGDETLCRTYVAAYLHGDSTIDIAIPLYGKSIRREACFATEEEKQKLFDAIKINGYKWNPETKTLKEFIEPKFKVGDKIRHRTIETNDIYNIVYINNFKYIVKKSNENDTYEIKFKTQDNWELIHEKFDITTLNPFDKVLVRDNYNEPWNINYFSYIDSTNMFKTIMGTYLQCIPYKNNEYLLGIADNCDNYYKTWK